MTNLVVLITLMLCYGIILIYVIERGFNRLLNHESRLSRYIRNMDELKDIVNDLNINDSRDIINYRINRIKNIINRFRNG